MDLVIENGILKKVYINEENAVVELPDTVEVIGDDAFFYCSNLKEIVIPSSVSVVGRRAFSGCANLEKITFSKGLKRIKEDAFMFCENLKDVKLPEGLIQIENRAFADCLGLTNVYLPDSIKVIGDSAFTSCTSLKDVKLPRELTYINNGCFECCLNLESVVLPSGIVGIWADAFANCQKLKNINFPEGLSVIASQAFFKCYSLDKIVLPDTVVDLGNRCFAHCYNVKDLYLSKSLKEIEDFAFYGCEGIQIVDIPEGVDLIGVSAFANCFSLKEIVLPDNPKLNLQTRVFFNDKSLEKVLISNYSHLHMNGISELLGDSLKNYAVDENLNLILLNDSIINDCYEKYVYAINCNKTEAMILSLMYEYEELCNLGDFKYLLGDIVKEIVSKDNINELKIQFNNCKEFNRLLKVYSEEYGGSYSASASKEYFSLFKLAYTLGMFSEDYIDRQRSCEFLSTCYQKGYLNLDTVHKMFEKLKFGEFNKDWAMFIMDKENFSKLIILENEQSNFISKIHNSFGSIKEYGRSNKGSQNYRKVTVDMCLKYLAEVNFKGVDGHNVDIAKTISLYTREQRSFDFANDIRDSYLNLKSEGKIDDHILGEELKEISAIVACDVSSTLLNLKEIADDKFTYEFLSKYDAINFVLGKFCSCCSHIEGQGKGIVVASVLHPDCQNLIIRDSNGKIVAKSTLYINRDEGYGVFNNVGINKSVDDKYKKIIYQKYLMAIENFANRYNELHPDNPLKQINVGMNLNDLSEQIRECDVSSKILKGIDFSRYGGHKGDWQKEQYVLWENDSIKR